MDDGLDGAENVPTGSGSTADRLDPGLGAERLRVVLALVFGTVLALGLGEVLARGYFAFRGGRDRGAVLEGRIVAHDPLLGFRHVPHAVARLKGPEFDTHIAINGNGLRAGREVPYAKPPGVRRILLVGDSFTFGHGVEVQERFGERLESLLPGTEVVNMGVGGTGTDQQLLLYLTEGIKYRADLVILCFMSENIERNVASERVQPDGAVVSKPRFVLEDGKLVLRDVPVPELRRNAGPAVRPEWERYSSGIRIPFKALLRDHSALYRLLQSRLSGPLRGLLKGSERLYPEYDETREEWQVTAALFERFAAETRTNGSDFLLAVLPTREDVFVPDLINPPGTMIRALGAREGLAVLDLTPGLREAGRHGTPDLYYYPRDGHWTPAGHAVAAQLLAEHLKEHRL